MPILLAYCNQQQVPELFVLISELFISDSNAEVLLLSLFALD